MYLIKLKLFKKFYHYSNNKRRARINVKTSNNNSIEKTYGRKGSHSTMEVQTTFISE